MKKIKALTLLSSLALTMCLASCGGGTTNSAESKAGESTPAGSQTSTASSSQLEKILREGVRYCNENGMEIAFTSPGWIEESVFEELNIPAPSCGACLSNMAVTPGGNIVPCQSWLSDQPLGSMLHDDWETIWESEICTAQRNYSSEMTGECPLRRYCQ